MCKVKSFDIDDTDQLGKDEPLKAVVTSKGRYLARKVILGVGLLHFPRKLPILDELAPDCPAVPYDTCARRPRRIPTSGRMDWSDTRRWR